jgi:16S rRNA processing protein RimM
MAKDRILVGQFGAAHGVKGELRLKSYTQDKAAIARYGALSDASGARHFEIAALRPLKDDLFVAREKLPAAEDEEFYHADLIGLIAKSEAGEAIGTIIQVLNFGGGDILEIAPLEKGETLLLPFTKAAVPVVDVAQGHVIVVPPVEVDEATPPRGEDHDAA